MDGIDDVGAETVLAVAGEGEDEKATTLLQTAHLFLLLPPTRPYGLLIYIYIYEG